MPRLVPLRGLVGARDDDDAPHAVLQREPVDTLHHVQVAPLAPVQGPKVFSLRPEVAAVDHRIDAGEEGLEVGVAGGEEVEDFDASEFSTRAVLSRTSTIPSS